MATTMQCLNCLSSESSRVPAIPCQFSNRAVGRNRQYSVGGGTGVCGIRAQTEAEEGNGAQVGGGGDEDFEGRLAKLQRKVTSGTGKKAELRKARKEGGGGGRDPYAATTSKPTKEGIFIPSVPLKEPVSDGLEVALGITPYTERFHGRLAALGLTAVLLVELATGDSLIKFHDSGTLTVQVYTVLGLAALFFKYEKERISIWPKSEPRSKE